MDDLAEKEVVLDLWREMAHGRQRKGIRRMSETWITIKMPESSWYQLIDDYENYCGVEAEEIEILQEIEFLGTEER